MSHYNLLVTKSIHIIAQKQKEISLRRNNLLPIEYLPLHLKWGVR